MSRRNAEPYHAVTRLSVTTLQEEGGSTMGTTLSGLLGPNRWVLIVIIIILLLDE